MIRFGRQVCGDLDQASQREWLVSDGLGGFAMGTVSGLLTRRYHGLLVVATDPPIGRRLGLVALDPVLVIGERRLRLATHEWAGGMVDPQGHMQMEAFWLRDGLPVWRWSAGDVCLERTLAMHRGRSALGVVHRLVRGTGVQLELSALCTWRDVHGERTAGSDPRVERTTDGFVFEEAYRVMGPGYQPGGAWYRGLRHREEAARGLNDQEDVWFAGTFGGDLRPGETLDVLAWAGELAERPPDPTSLEVAARDRAARIVTTSRPLDEADATLALAADQLIVRGPRVVAGYPWFGEWSRDSMTSYEGLFLETRRWKEGRDLLLLAAASLSEGMLANTADVGGSQYNTADATLWFMHAVGRHVGVTHDLDLGSELADALTSVVEHHAQGTRYGIRVDPVDGLLEQGAPGLALTWMDARVDGIPVTQRAGKAVEVNALWINGLGMLSSLLELLKRPDPRITKLEALARRSFPQVFLRDGRLLDVAQGPDGDDAAIRPNSLLAVSLPLAPMDDAELVRQVGGRLLTSVGLRSLAAEDPRYVGRHRGGPEQRDRAYHQGTVWPWLIGPYVEAALKTGVDLSGVLDGLELSLGEWGLGSVSETADGDPPHMATGAPFQAWSVAELLRARRLLKTSRSPSRPPPRP